MRWLLFVVCCSLGVAIYAYMRHRARITHREEMIDHTLEDSFPASDAPSWTPTYGANY